MQQKCTQLESAQCHTITQQKDRVIDTHHEIITIALSPNGKFIASAGLDDYGIHIWDLITGHQVGTGLIGHKKDVNSIKYSKCGDFLVSGSTDMTIRQWNVLNGSQIGEPIKGHKSDITQVQYSEDYIISCSLDQSVRVWNQQTGKEYQDKRIQMKEAPIWCLSLSPITSEVVFGDRQGMIAIWDYEQHQEKYLLKGHTGCVYSIQYSNDGKLIVSGSKDKTILMLDAQTGISIRQFSGHNLSVYSVGFSPDSQLIISGGHDLTVRIWNSATGKQIGQKLTHHQEELRSTQFSQCGKYIITGGNDKLIWIRMIPIN